MRPAILEVIGQPVGQVVDGFLVRFLLLWRHNGGRKKAESVFLRLCVRLCAIKCRVRLCRRLVFSLCRIKETKTGTGTFLGDRCVHVLPMMVRRIAYTNFAGFHPNFGANVQSVFVVMALGLSTQVQLTKARRTPSPLRVCKSATEA